MAEHQSFSSRIIPARALSWQALVAEERAADFFEQAIDGLRQQVWIGFLIIWLVGVTATRWMRYNAGVEATAATITMMVVIYGIIFTSLWLRNSRYTRITQTAFLVMMHLMVPIGLFFYGSIQGLGDIALYSMMIVSLVLGWRWWMYITFFGSLVALIYVYYLTLVGLPTLPFLEYTPIFATIKVLSFSGVIGFTIYYGSRFYISLLNRHQQFAEEQVRLTKELQASDRELRQLTQELMASRQQIVTAQDEERRRLRSDLTDELGPRLAGLVLRAGAAQQLLPAKQEKADQVLEELETGIEQVLEDVRHFVYALRPPLLDQLGLLGAIRELTNQFSEPLQVKLILPDQLTLGAATEVACFKIVQATLEHLAKTKDAHRCTVMLAEEYENIVLSIGTDVVENLVNITTNLPSIQEWAEELTGTLEILTQESGNSCLYAQLPNTLQKRSP